MAQVGYTPLKLYYSITTTNAPLAANLSLGELAINAYDGKLFYKDNGGAVQVIGWKTTPTTAGGTGLTSWTAGDVPYYATGTALSKLSIGTAGQVLTSTGSAPQWSTISGVAVTTFSAGTTGFTPASATAGAITLAGTLVVANGGTGATSLTGYVKGSGTTAFTASSTIPVGDLSGTLPVASGGTGATTAGNARLNLSAAQSGANTDITSIALTTGTITTTPSSSNDLVNKSYADSIATGVNFHPACNYATTADLGTVTYNNGSSGVGATLTNAGTQAVLVIDGHTFTGTDVTNGVRVLVKNQSNGAYNGVYTVTNQGSGSTNWQLTRATDYDTSGVGTNEIDAGDLLLVLSGTANANTSWVQQTLLPITVGTTALVFVQFAAVQTYTAGTGLTLSLNQFSITNVGTASTYGSATQTPVFTTNGQGQVTSVTNTTITPAVGSITGLGTGVATALAVNTSTAGGMVLFNGALGTPTSGTLTNATGLPLTSGVTGTLPIANGGTGQTTASAAFNALSPITTTGDIIIGNGTNSATRLAIGTNGYVLTSNGTTATWAASAGGVTTISFGATGLTPSTATGGAVTVAGTLALANGGTGATTVSGAQTNLQVDPAGTAVAMAIALG